MTVMTLGLIQDRINIANPVSKIAVFLTPSNELNAVYDATVLTQNAIKSPTKTMMYETKTKEMEIHKYIGSFDKTMRKEEVKTTLLKAQIN